MAVLATTVIQCDQCPRAVTIGTEPPGTLTEDSARLLARLHGWRLILVNHRLADLCPTCATSRALMRRRPRLWLPSSTNGSAPP